MNQQERLELWKRMMKATGLAKLSPGQLCDAVEDPKLKEKMDKVYLATDISPFFQPNKK